MSCGRRVRSWFVHPRRPWPAVPVLLALLLCPVAGQGRQGDPGHVSLSVEDADLRQVLHQLAGAARLNLVLDEAVQGRVSLRVRARPARAVLDELLQAQGLAGEQAGGLLRVAAFEALTTRARQQRDWEAAREAREPVVTRLLPLRHARAADLAKLLEGGAAPGAERLLGPRGRLDVDLRTNTLLITDNANRLASWPDWLAVLDRPARQVVIETRLAVVSRSLASQLGARWGLQRAGLAAQVPLAVADSASLRYGVVGLDGHLLDVELSALESSGEGEVIARPGVMTSEQQVARIASGQQIPYQETTQSGASTTRFVNAELSLEVTPSVSAHGDIMLDLRLSQDSPGDIQPSGARAIETNRLSTQVRLRDGQTLMLGGIFRTQRANSVSKVPGLGNIPYLGYLFRRHVVREDKQELLIFVTPRLADDPVPGAAEMADGSDSPQHIPRGADGRGQDHDRPPAG